MAFTSLSINFTPVADFDNQNNNLIVQNAANDPIVPDTIAPIPRERAE